MYHSGFRALFYLKYVGKNWRVFYHVSSSYCSKRNLVPDEFVSISKTATSFNVKSRRSGKKSTESAQDLAQDRRLDKSSISKKEYLYGIFPCLAALVAKRRKFYTIYINEDASNVKSRLQFNQIKALAEKQMIARKTVSKKRLDDLCGNRLHQNIIMKVDNLGMIPFIQEQDFHYSLDTEKLNERPPFWVVLEHIQDPMNMGAILRTSAYLGVDKVISSESDSCSLTPAVSKASAGAMEALPLYSTNILQLLKKKVTENWDVLGTVHPHHVPKGNCPPVIACEHFQLEKPSLLVLGNEGSGLTPEAQSLCTKFLTIQSNMRHSFGDLDSLNVSVATGILLHSILSSKSS